MTAVIHIAGLDVQVGPILRQRCSWCGAMLEEYDRMPAERELRPAMWEAGVLVAVHSNASWVVDHEDGADMPNNSCAMLDPAVTR